MGDCMNKLLVNIALFCLNHVRFGTAFMDCEVKDAKEALRFLRRIS